MFDYIKAEVSGVECDSILSNPLLNFESKYFESTAELSNWRYANHKNLTFIVTSNGRVTIKGSLHKYFNDGKHNYNRFTEDNLNFVLDDIRQKFDVQPELCRIQNIEIGTNLKGLPVSSQELLNGFIMSRNQRFKDVSFKKADYRQVDRSQSRSKVYDKAWQFGLPYENLRFELNLKKSQKIESVCGAISIADLTKKEVFDSLSNQLVKSYDDVLFFDSRLLNSLHGTELLDAYKWSRPSYWESLSGVINTSKKNQYYNELKKCKSTWSNQSGLGQTIRDSIESELGRFYTNRYMVNPSYVIN